MEKRSNKAGAGQLFPVSGSKRRTRRRGTRRRRKTRRSLARMRKRTRSRKTGRRRTRRRRTRSRRTRMRKTRRRRKGGRARAGRCSSLSGVPILVGRWTQWLWRAEESRLKPFFNITKVIYGITPCAIQYFWYYRVKDLCANLQCNAQHTITCMTTAPKAWPWCNTSLAQLCAGAGVGMTCASLRTCFYVAVCVFLCIIFMKV